MNSKIENAFERLKLIVNYQKPVYKNSVFFDSYHGLYNDNPKYISEKLHELRPDTDIFWVIDKELVKNNLPEYVNVIEPSSSKRIEYEGRAEVFIDNHSGSDGRVLGVLNFAPIMRKKNRLRISTWHGTPIKKIARDEPGGNKAKKKCRISNYILAGCSYAANILKNAFCDDYPVKMYGTPRNDSLFNEKIDVLELKSSLGLPRDKKIILFAPTFRKDVDQSGVNQMNEFEFDKLFCALNQRFGGEWAFVFRVHNSVLKKIDVQSLTDKYGDRIINGNIGSDMAEYMVCADVMITDYTSSIFDFALTKKPCFLYVPDIEHYERVERGFYMSLREMPYPISVTTDELYSEIICFDIEKCKTKCDEFLAKIGNKEDGHATERVVNEIIDFLDK